MVGSILVRNEGGFLARFQITFVQDGRPVKVETESFPLGVQKDLAIPDYARDYQVKIEEMVWPLPAVWSTIAIYSFETPVVKSYKVFGTTLQPGIEDITPARV